jgi:hypothetical protein
MLSLMEAHPVRTTRLKTIRKKEVLIGQVSG